MNNTSFKDKEILVWDNSKNNIGMGSAHNRLANKAKGDYLFFLNNDTLVKTDIFESLLKSPYDISGCRRFNYSGSKELIGGFSIDKFGFPSGRTGKVFYPDGAMFMNRKVFDILEGFDEKTFLYGEDRDFCWRSWLLGYKVGICNSAIFYHSTHSALGKVNYTRRYHSEKNTIRYMLKNYTLKSLVRILPEYAFWALLELSLMVLTNPVSIFKAYLPAYWWNIKNFKDTMNERSKVIHLVPDNKLPFSKEIGKFYVLKTQGVPQWA